MKDLVTITSSVLPESTRVLGLRGSEAISRPYEHQVFLQIQEPGGAAIDMSDAIGARVVITIDREEDGIPPFHLSGILASLELLREVGGRALLSAIVVPKLWLLGLSKHSRMFTRKSVPEVIEAVLQDNGLTTDDYELRLTAYEVEEHVCQYRESDLDFISRWMEREGIYYFFEHTEDGEKLILCDDRAYESDVLGTAVRYHPQTGQDHSAGASFRAFTCRHATVPSVVKLKDYDYARPNLPITGTADVAPNGSGEVSLYGERFFSPNAGARLARIRADELASSRTVYRASGSRLHLRAGYTFELEEHPWSSFNTKYLNVETRYHVNQAAGAPDVRELLGFEHDEVYFVEVTAISADLQFRAASRTPWPRIYGYENAIIDGSAESEYAQIDDQGRYNVKFKFDESTLKDGAATTWVRMMQPHGGTVEGFHFPLRKGTEVICSFLSGDPDRPVIVGVVPNRVTPSQVVAANHTQNIIQTGGRNYIVMEDQGGGQFINIFCPMSMTNLYLGAPRTMGPHSLLLPAGPQVPTEGKRPQTLGPFNFDLRTQGAGQIHTGSHLNIDSDGQLQVEAHGLTTIYANADWHLDVNGAANEKYWTTFKKEVLSDVDIDYQAKHDLFVKGDSTTTIGEGNYTHIITAGNTLVDTQAGTTDIKSNGKLTIETQDQCEVKVKSNMMLTVDGNVSKEIKGSEELKTYGPYKKLFSSTNVNVVAGFKSDTFLGLANSNFIGVSVNTFFGGKVTLEMAGSFSATFAIKADITNGASLTYKMGVHATVNAAVEFGMKPVQARQYGVVVGLMGNKIMNHLIKLETAGTHVMI